MSRQVTKRTLRQAVTLIEVVFSIGVVLIGLLGLLSVLPLAGRRAQDAISLSVGPKFGEQVVSELQSKRYLTSGRLRPIPATTSVTVANLSLTPTPTPFCIDPMLASSTGTPPASLVNGYTVAFFPYYNTTHNPVADPSTSSTWASQPRMQRVGITQQRNVALYLGVAEALELAENSDDLILTRPEDRSVGASLRDGQVQARSGGLEYGKRIPSGQYSWFATVNPLPGGVYASVSVVVVKNRERAFNVPTVTTPPDDPEGNAISERLGYVTYGSGFTGGAGGIVHVVSNGNTISRIRSDDWIMLSRNVSGTSAGPVWHRWYRVVSVNGKAEEFVIDGTDSTDDTNLGARFSSGAGTEVWRHKLLLDGPDWEFGFVVDPTVIPPVERDYADNSYADNTYATIVEGVVSVTERVVLLSDL